MALSRKKSRPITVDGREYRWQVRLPGERELGYEVVWVSIQQGDGAGRLLRVLTPCQDMFLHLARNEPHGGPYEVTPRDVAKMIREARGLGWDGELKGPTFEAEMNLGALRVRQPDP